MQTIKDLNEILNRNGLIHISGIGGIGMSGIAIHLKNIGFNVQGSDTCFNANIAKLEAIGIKILLDQSPNNLYKVDLIIKSTAVKDSNPEIEYAINNGIYVMSRAEALNFLMEKKISIAVTGAHGKTTTSAMLSSILMQTKKDPSVLVGGILTGIGTNAIAGKSNLFVAEADESDGTMATLTPTYSVITNIDHEHMDYYKTFDNLKQSFSDFINKTSQISYVFADQPELYDLAKNYSKVKFYGESKNSYIKLLNYNFTEEGATFDFSIGAEKFEGYQITKVGKHNILNSLPVIAIAKELNIEDELIRESLLKFAGVERRFTKIPNNLNITIVDDYAHHPNEIKAVLETAKLISKGRVFAVIQLHRFSRFNNLFNEFCKIATIPDYSYFTSIYAAGEQEIQGLSHYNLIANVKNSGFKNIDDASNVIDLSRKIATEIREGDTVIFLGAGNITKWAAEFPAFLNSALNNDVPAAQKC